MSGRAIAAALLLASGAAHAEPPRRFDHGEHGRWVITRDEIDARAYGSIGEALGTVPGLIVVDDGTEIQLGARGYLGGFRGGTRTVAMLVDGHRAQIGDRRALAEVDVVPIAAVERIEIVFGPGGSVFEVDSLVAVVRVITRRQTPAVPATSTAAATATATATLEVARVGRGDITAAGGLVAEAPFGPGALRLYHQTRDFDRSGLALPCGTTAPDTVDPCAAQTAEAIAPRFGLETQGDRAGTSLTYATLDVDLAALVAGGDAPTAADGTEVPGRYGRLTLDVTRTTTRVSGGFADTSVLEAEARKATGTPAATSNQLATITTELGAAYLIGVPRAPATIELDVRHGWTRDPPGRALLTTAGAEADPDDRYGTSELALVLEGHALGPPPSSGPHGPIDDLVARATIDYTRSGSNVDPDGSSGRAIHAVTERLRYGIDFDLRALGGHVELVGSAALSDFRTLGPAGGARCDAGQLCTLSPIFRAAATVTTGSLGRVTLAGQPRSLIDQLSLAVAVARGDSVPFVDDLFHVDRHGMLVVTGDPTLVASTNQQVDGSLDARFAGGLGHLRVSLYYADVDNSLGTTVNGTTISWQTESDARTTGLTIAAELRAGPLALDAAWDRQLSRTATQLDVRAGAPRDDARVAATALWSAAHLDASLAARYTGERAGYRGNLGHAGSYLLPTGWELDAALVASPLHLIADQETRVSLTVHDLLDRALPRPGFQPVYRSDLPGVPRSFLLTISQTL